MFNIVDMLKDKAKRKMVARVLLFVSKPENLKIENIGKKLRMSLYKRSRPDNDPEVLALTKQAEMEYARENYKKSCDLYAQVVKLQPVNVYVLLPFIEASAKAGRMREATFRSLWGVVLSGGRAEFLMVSAECFRQLGQDDMARKGFELVLASKDEDESTILTKRLSREALQRMGVYSDMDNFDAAPLSVG